MGASLADALVGATRLSYFPGGAKRSSPREDVEELSAVFPLAPAEAGTDEGVDVDGAAVDEREEPVVRSSSPSSRAPAVSLRGAPLLTGLAAVAVAGGWRFSEGGLGGLEVGETSAVPGESRDGAEHRVDDSLPDTTGRIGLAADFRALLNVEQKSKPRRRGGGERAGWGGGGRAEKYAG